MPADRSTPQPRSTNMWFDAIKVIAAIVAILGVILGVSLVVAKIDRDYAPALLGVLEQPPEHFFIIPDSQGTGPLHPAQRMHYVEPVRERILGYTVKISDTFDMTHTVTCDSQKSIDTYGAAYAFELQKICTAAQRLINAPADTSTVDPSVFDALIITNDNVVIDRAGRRLCLVVDGKAEPLRLQRVGDFLEHKNTCQAMIDHTTTITNAATAPSPAL